MAPTTFTPAGGNYASNAPLAVTLNTINAGDSPATYYYTTDGSTPTTSSTAFTNNNGCYGCLGAGPITITNSETIKAIAVAAG